MAAAAESKVKRLKIKARHNNCDEVSFRKAKRNKSKNLGTSMPENLNERLFNFAVKVLNFLKSLPRTPEMNVIRYQLAKCSTSSGANYSPRQT